jgi:hypothetical protein
MNNKPLLTKLMTCIAFEEAEKWIKFKPEQFHGLSSLDEIKQSLRQKRPVLADIMFGGEAYCKGVTRSGQVSAWPLIPYGRLTDTFDRCLTCRMTA